jgi:hypothetical protein
MPSCAVLSLLYHSAWTSQKTFLCCSNIVADETCLFAKPLLGNLFIGPLHSNGHMRHNIKVVLGRLNVALFAV